jgi:hypothetical protein
LARIIAAFFASWRRAATGRAGATALAAAAALGVLLVVANVRFAA